jgi:hypothetical protein
MCNCGNKRNTLANTTVTGSVYQQPLTSAAPTMWPDINFMYTGQSALTVTGSASGRQYRFNAPGEHQLIDYRDAPFMMKVPVLKKVM